MRGAFSSPLRYKDRKNHVLVLPVSSIYGILRLAVLTQDDRIGYSFFLACFMDRLIR